MSRSRAVILSRVDGEGSLNGAQEVEAASAGLRPTGVWFLEAQFASVRSFAVYAAQDDMLFSWQPL